MRQAPILWRGMPVVLALRVAFGLSAELVGAAQAQETIATRYK